MNIKAKFFCKSCSNNFKIDKEMIVVQVDPVDEKLHFYKCPGCNKVSFIQEDFCGKEELESEKIYM